MPTTRSLRVAIFGKLSTKNTTKLENSSDRNDMVVGTVRLSYNIVYIFSTENCIKLNFLDSSTKFPTKFSTFPYKTVLKKYFTFFLRKWITKNFQPSRGIFVVITTETFGQNVSLVITIYVKTAINVFWAKYNLAIIFFRSPKYANLFKEIQKI